MSIPRVPLAGVRVLDLTQGEAGPYASMHLGDLGAEVLKIEPPWSDWARNLAPPSIGKDSALFWGLNRNKKSIAINLQKPEGKQIALRLAETVDIFLESFRPGVIERLGLGYDVVSHRNPPIIFCSLSTFGQSGPIAQKPASELEVQGITGLLRFQGRVGQDPIRVGCGFASATAALYAVIGIISALVYRTRTGKGQKVSCSVLAAMVATQNQYFLSDNDPDVMTPTFPVQHLQPQATGYRTRDLPIHFTFWRDPERNWRKFCHAVGLRHLTEDPQYQTLAQREERAAELRTIYEEAFGASSSKDLLTVLEDCDAVCSVEHTYETLFQDPQAIQNGMLAELNHRELGKVKAVGLPWKFAKTPGKVSLPAPALGEHTQEVLENLGYSGSEISRMEKAGIVKCDDLSPEKYPNTGVPAAGLDMVLGGS